MMEETLVRMAAPTLAGIKTGPGFPMKIKKELRLPSPQLFLIFLFYFLFSASFSARRSRAVLR